MPSSRPHILHPARAWVLPALFSLMAAFSPDSLALPKAYVVVLKYPIPSQSAGQDYVQIINPDGVFGIPAAGYGGYIDKGFITAKSVSEEQLARQFGPALDAMQDILKMGLPTLSHSYAVLLEPEADRPGYLHVDLKSDSFDLNAPGQAMLIDGYSSNPFILSTGQLDADFGPLLKTLAETRQAGLPVRTYVVLLENPDGMTGKIMVTNERGTTTIDQSGEAMSMDPGATGTFQVDQEQLRTDFGPALDAFPPLPSHVTLFFELGSTRLTPDSQAGLDKLLAELRKRPMPEISVQGHTDTVGKEAFNNRLSKKRADYVADRIRRLADTVELLQVEAYGQHRLLVATPRNTPEQRNRRAEIFIR
ncbi:MAG: OmpA family protein [Gallionellaceae bacterium]|nr:OmpA family protein [Gallionellaceae bacterium]